MVELLGRPHSLEVLYAIQTSKKLRFSELRSVTRVNASTLTKRLRELIAAGLLVRERFREIPPRVEYRLTRKGKELARIFESMGRWHRKFGRIG